MRDLTNNRDTERTDAPGKDEYDDQDDGHGPAVAIALLASLLVAALLTASVLLGGMYVVYRVADGYVEQWQAQQTEQEQDDAGTDQSSCIYALRQTEWRRA